MSPSDQIHHYYEDGRNELYNIAQDVGEQTDVAANFPGRVEAMSQHLTSWLAQVEARKPITNPNFNPEEYAQQQMRIRDKQKPNLESEHARLLKPDFKPRGGCWEETGK